MKAIRIILSIIFFLPSYPILFATYSMMFIVTIMGFGIGISIIFAWPSGNKEWIEECKEAWMMFVMPFWMPFKVWYEYIKKGKFNIE